MFIKYEKVFERDIDMLIINKFINSRNIVELFLNKVGLSNYDVFGIEHSLMDDNGETDITITLKNGKHKIAFLIEDKIDAIAMPSQRDRYTIRGNKGINEDKYDKFFVFIVAPQDYLDTNIESKKYENRISYEELLVCFQDDLFAKSLIEHAIEEKKNGYVVIENTKITNFWEKYYEFIDDKYPNFKIRKYDRPRGSNATWAIFCTPIKGIVITHKSERGFMDLTFQGLADKFFEVKNIISNSLDDDMSLEVVTKSLAVRIKVPIVNFESDFDDCINELDLCFKAVDRLLNLLEKIDYVSILNLKDN
jgi:hypothetical protein